MGKADDVESALENLYDHSQALELLAAHLRRFNIFEAVGMVRAEIRHSNFLAYLLRPNEAHGLQDRFLRKILRLIRPHEGYPLLTDNSILDLTDVSIFREKDNIDILIKSDRSKIAFAIENKIDALPDEQQLIRYSFFLGNRYRDYRRAVVLLAPSNSLRSFNLWRNVLAYEQVVDCLNELLEEIPAPSHDVGLAICHYIELIRSHVMVDKDVVEKAQAFYAKHQRALDFIFDNAIDRSQEIQAKLIIEINSHHYITVEHANRYYTYFIPSSWKHVPGLMDGTKGVGCVVGFCFETAGDRLRLSVKICPGDAEFRRKVFNVMSEELLFQKKPKELTEEWTTFVVQELLAPSEFRTMTCDHVAASIPWEDLQRGYLVPIENKILAAFKSE